MNIYSIQRIVVSLLVLSFIFQPAIISLSFAGEKQFKEAQSLIEKTAAKYPEIVRLTIHAVPTGEQQNRIIACNIKEKIGKLSDPEDIEAMKNGKTVVLKEGDNLDVTAPIFDRTGKPVAATGITLLLKKGSSEQAAIEKAKIIAKELSEVIQNAKNSLW
jgi:hypothetical protein